MVTWQHPKQMESLCLLTREADRIKRKAAEPGLQRERNLMATLDRLSTNRTSGQLFKALQSLSQPQEFSALFTQLRSPRKSLIWSRCVSVSHLTILQCIQWAQIIHQEIPDGKSEGDGNLCLTLCLHIRCSFPSSLLITAWMCLMQIHSPCFWNLQSSLPCLSFFTKGALPGPMDPPGKTYRTWTEWEE